MVVVCRLSLVVRGSLFAVGEILRVTNQRERPTTSDPREISI
jgi:hypothetical protein